MLISCDAAQLEWRVAVELSQDPVGLKEILEKQDTHELNKQAFSLPTRLISKVYLFRTIFRGSGWSFANDPDFIHVSNDPDYWDEVNVKFYRKYRGLDAKHQEWIAKAWASEPIVGPFGRQWGFSPFLDDNGRRKISVPALTNYPVQGTGADILSIARVSLRGKLRRAKIPAEIITSVHDSIVTDSAGRHLESVSRIMHETFADLIPNIKKLFGYEWKTPLTCEVFYGQNLKDLTEYK